MRIRIGNSFEHAWVLENSEDSGPIDLNTAIGMTVTARVNRTQRNVPYEIVGNDTLLFKFDRSICDIIGDYNLELNYFSPDTSLAPKDREKTIDIDAFTIVSRTAQADDVKFITSTSDIAMAFKGDKGDPFTFEDFTPEQLKNIEQPITDFVAVAEVAENQREENEDVRIDNESGRVQAELTRQSSESERNEAEGLRVNSESSRVSAETLRLQSEEIRIPAEAERKANEVDRLADEASRASDELIREANESTRNQDEATRKTNENERETAETTRVSNENNRVTAEEQRVASETTREQQEEARQTNTATAITNAENAITDVNTAKDDYYDVVKPAIQVQGEYATAQGNYAKAQGEAVEGTVSSINNNTLTIEEVTAQAIVAMQNRIVALEKILSEGILDKIKIMNLDIIDNFNIWGKSNLILTGNSAPNVIPDFTGQTFIDTTNKVAYTATGNNSVLDWK